MAVQYANNRKCHSRSKFLGLHVALCFNRKPESYAEIQEDSEDEEPPPHNCFSERYAEFDDDHTIQAISKALMEEHNVTLIEGDDTAYNKFSEHRPDIVFNIAEGNTGPYREAFIPSILEYFQIPYTGSNPLTLSICLDKHMTKQLLKSNMIPTPESCLVPSIEKIASKAKSWKEYPCIIKPVYEGSSIGIRNSSIANNWQQLADQLEITIATYHQPALVERLLLGREFTVGILGNGDDAIMLPPVEICYDSLPENANPIYSYEAKWIWDTPKKPLNMFKCPADIDPKLFRKLKEVALSIYHLFRCRDWARIDIRLDVKGEPNVLEINPLPGILPNPEDNSCMPKAASAAGIEYNELILQVLGIACKRYKIKTRSTSLICIQ
ncbi:D-alanine--D-alanine ligase family protein [[Eubacterium] cellulosolvens]